MHNARALFGTPCPKCNKESGALSAWVDQELRFYFRCDECDIAVEVSEQFPNVDLFDQFLCQQVQRQFEVDAYKKIANEVTVKCLDTIVERAGIGIIYTIE